VPSLHGQHPPSANCIVSPYRCNVNLARESLSFKLRLQFHLDYDISNPVGDHRIADRVGAELGGIVALLDRARTTLPGSWALTIWTCSGRARAPAKAAIANHLDFISIPVCEA
jgi:hypothetical protein